MTHAPAHIRNRPAFSSRGATAGPQPGRRPARPDAKPDADSSATRRTSPAGLAFIAALENIVAGVYISAYDIRTYGVNHSLRNEYPAPGGEKFEDNDEGILAAMRVLRDDLWAWEAILPASIAQALNQAEFDAVVFESWRHQSLPEYICRAIRDRRDAAHEKKRQDETEYIADWFLIGCGVPWLHEVAVSKAARRLFLTGDYGIGAVSVWVGDPISSRAHSLRCSRRIPRPDFVRLLEERL